VRGADGVGGGDATCAAVNVHPHLGHHRAHSALQRAAPLPVLGHPGVAHGPLPREGGRVPLQEHQRLVRSQVPRVAPLWKQGRPARPPLRHWRD
jgi:hypothetical protein